MEIDAACFVYGVAFLLAAGIAAYGGWRWMKRRRQGQEGRSPSADPLSEPLLDAAAAHPEEEQQTHLIKGVAGLWTRQALVLLQAALQTTLTAYALATGGEGELPSPPSTRWAAARHGLAAITYLSLAGVEELMHRTSPSGRLPLAILVAYLLTATAAVLPPIHALLADSSFTGVEGLARFVDAWSGVVALLLALLALSAATCRPAPVRRRAQPPTPEEKASLISCVIFGWFTPYLYRGLRQKKMDGEDDLPPLGEGDRAHEVWAVFRPLVARMGLGGSAIATTHDDDAREEKQQEGDAERLTAPLLGRSTGTRMTTKKKHWKGTRVARLLFQLGSWDVVIQAAWQAIGSLAVFIAPLALREIVDFVSHYGDQESRRIPTRVLVCTAALFLGPAIQAVADGRNFFVGRRLILRYRAALLGLIFRKALCIDMSAGTSSSIGELTNLCSVDANSVEAVGYIHFLWSTLLQILVCVSLIFNVLGPSALAGLAFMIVSLPITAWASARIQRDQTRMMKRKDARMSIVSEVLQGIKIIKLFAWERNFQQRIDRARDAELRDLSRFVYTRSIIIITWDATPTLVALCTFLVHTLALGKPLTAAAGFAALSLFDLLRFPLVVLPDMINYISKALVSFGRIEAFLDREEVESPPSLSAQGEEGEAVEKGGLLIRDGVFRWGSAVEVKEGATAASVTPTLHGINLAVRPGSLVCVYGPTGAGKTSLLMALIGEIRRAPESGASVKRGQGRVAYVGQKAWIRNATLRDNVTFGLPYDEGKYQRTVAACALGRDLGLLEAGDMTEIGEKGVNLSGGQQQRVNLARAVYRSLMGEADIVLMDDVLSAVDAHVGEHIFRDCIANTGALQGKTRVLVTHQVALTLPQADWVVIMAKDGSILEQGSRETLQDRAADLLERYGVIQVKDDDDGPEEEEEEGPETSVVNGGDATVPNGKQQQGKKKKPPPPAAAAAAAASDAVAPKETGKGTGRLVEEEARAQGALTLATYRAYARAMGGLAVALLLVGEYGAVELLRYLQTQSLGRWVDRLVANGAGNATLQGAGPFILLSFAATLVILLRALTQCWSSLRASRAVHRAMAARVLRAPCHWFERTPIGRALNRFASDVETIDKNLMDSCGSFLECALNAAAVVAVIAARAPPLLAGLLPLLALAAWVSRAYLACSRELKRLEAVRRSPIYSHFSETVGGVSVVRAYGVQAQFVAESEQRVNAYSRVDFFLWTANRWLAVRLQLLGAVVTGLVGAYILLSLPYGRLSGSTAGLTLLYAMQFSSALNWLIRNQSELEMNMNSMERAAEYCHLEQEAPEVNPAYGPPSDAWPDKGAVRISHLTLRYPSAATPVIKDLSFSIPPGTRVGVVGRTGAGKSSLLSALYRLVEPEQPSTPGQPPCSLRIDGVEVLKLGLRDLRSRLAIVPQDPTLFRGTVRSNMDPFNEYDDAALHDALRRAHLAETLARKHGQKAREEAQQQAGQEGVNKTKSSSKGGDAMALPRKAWRRLRSAVSLPSLVGAAEKAALEEEAATARLTGVLSVASSDSGGEGNGEGQMGAAVAGLLSMEITENGDNLSVGERQLLCMARALLRKRAILIMDEATANVDPETDALIQETLKSEFVGCTVLTVAHRLATVVFYDRILVMDQGQVREYGPPLTLLGDTGGQFYSMCEKTGDLPRLVALAREAAAASAAAQSRPPAGGSTPATAAAAVNDGGLNGL